MIEGVPGLIQAFARGDSSEVSGPEGLRERVGELLAATAGEPGEWAFVVDANLPDNAARALAYALAGNREALGRGRWALVSFAVEAGAFASRVEAPLGDDAYAVIRAARSVQWRPEGDGGGIAGGWAGLAAASRLDWRAPAGRRHVALLLDERRTARFARDQPLPPADPGAPPRVAAWARAGDAALHVLVSRMELDDGNGAGVDARPDAGAPLALVAAMFRDGRYVRAGAPGDLAGALEGALARAAGDGGPAEVVLVIDRSGLMGASLGELARAGPALDRFVAEPGRRVAVVGWGVERPVVAAAFSSRRGAAAAAIARLRRGPPGDGPKDLLAAVAVARELPWRADARKTVVVMTAARARLAVAGDAVLDWADDAKVAVEVVERATASDPAG